MPPSPTCHPLIGISTLVPNQLSPSHCCTTALDTAHNKREVGSSHFSTQNLLMAFHLMKRKRPSHLVPDSLFGHCLQGLSSPHIPSFTPIPAPQMIKSEVSWRERTSEQMSQNNTVLLRCVCQEARWVHWLQIRLLIVSFT